MNKIELSRRLVLHRVMTVTGAVAMAGVTENRALAQAKSSQQAVAYQDKPQGSQRCDNCSLFEPPAACKTVEGQISPQGWCRIYAPKAN
jgi:hypothetical protein